MGGMTDSERLSVKRVVRITGEVQWRATVANSALEARWGIILVSNAAEAAGAIPDAFDDSIASWYINRACVWDEPTVEYRRYEMDLRSSRKIPQDYTLSFMAANNSTSDGILEFMFGFRILYERT